MSSFDEMYNETPPWDIGRAQSEIVTLEENGSIRGRVLDAGCGTGENALYLASKGYQVRGVDLSPTAIAKARAKATERGLSVEFAVHDVLDLEGLDQEFDTVIDSGVFHTFSDEDGPRLVASVASVLPPGGAYHMISFSELEPGSWGPRPSPKDGRWRTSRTRATRPTSTTYAPWHGWPRRQGRDDGPGINGPDQAS